MIIMNPPLHQHPPPPPGHPEHKPPHIMEKKSLVKSLLISTIVAIVFYFILNYYQVPLAGAVPATVALWTGLVVILGKLLMEHP